jgi:hypothetical protein
MTIQFEQRKIIAQAIRENINEKNLPALMKEKYNISIATVYSIAREFGITKVKRSIVTNRNTMQTKNTKDIIEKFLNEISMFEKTPAGTLMIKGKNGKFTSLKKVIETLEAA